MKFIFLSCILSFLFCPLFGQSNDYYSDHIYVNIERVPDSSNISSIEVKDLVDDLIYHYSPDGKISKTVAKTKEGVVNRTQEYFYDNAGRIEYVNTFSLISHSTGLINSGKIEYSYNSKNKIFEKRHYFWGVNPPSNAIHKKEKFLYNEHGLLIAKELSIYGSRINTEKYKYFYINDVISEVVKSRNGVLANKEKFTYDPNGNLTKIEFFAGTEKTVSAMQLFMYHANGNLDNVFHRNLNFNNEYSVGYEYYEENELPYQNIDITTNKQDATTPSIQSQPSSISESKPVSLISYIPVVSQFSNNQKLKGILFLSGVGYTTYSAISNKSLGDQKYNDYKKATNVDDILSLYDEADNYRKKCNLFLAITGGIAMYAIIDGVLVANKKSNNNVSVYPYFDGESVWATISINLR